MNRHEGLNLLVEGGVSVVAPFEVMLMWRIEFVGPVACSVPLLGNLLYALLLGPGNTRWSTCM